MTYLRLPHLHDDLLCFVAEDDLWLAPLDAPGRAWRLTVDRTKLGHPRFSPDGRHLAYTSWRSLVPEVHVVPVDGGPGRQVSHWGSADTRVCGWTPDGEILAVASHGEPFSYFTWAYKVAPAGDPGRKLPWGPVSDIQVADVDGERRSLLLTGTPPHEPASWKRYRGGATGRLWLHGERLLEGLGGHLHSPMFAGGRIAFLSDHEGVANLYSCAPDGSGLRRHTDHDAFYARHAASDGTRVVYQCAGDLWIVDDLSPDSEPRRLDVRLSGPPDGERLAVASHDGRLLLVDVTEDSGGEVTELIRSINGPVRDLAFSPDGAWLTWSHPGIGRSLRQIKMARLAGTPDGERLIVDVTNGRFEDENPVFTRDGRYLAFLSWRGFDPVYDVHTGDLSFPLGCRPYLVPLSSATPSPFAVNPEGRPAAGGLDPVEDDDNGDNGAVTVEVEGLESRVTPFPVAASKYSALHPVAGGGLVWLRWPISGALGETFANPDDTSGRPTLEHFSITKARKSELAQHLDWFAVSGDGSRLVVVDEGELRAVPANEPGDSDSTVWIDARRILHVVDPAAEWRQSYEEAGRLIRAYFWEPHMSGIDWDGVLDQYRPLVERVASPDEFADLLREVLGELGTSHAYVTASRRDEGPPHYQRRQGLLGANFVRRDGGWAVKRILLGDSSDSRARSPLAGTGIREGAVLTHVDGRPVDPDAGPYPLLAGAGGTTVELTFTPAEDSAEGQGPPRRVAVVPLVDERPLRYQDWVAKRRAVVRELSGGRCGYLHIPDMGGSGWAQFNRDLRMEVSRPALIVDVRGNAGGHISELVIETLSRTILGWDLTRDAQPVSYPSNAPRGPLVALADEATSSDGDMITAAFKLLKLGPVVGQRTWGGVVGMTGRHELGDGTVITVPMNAAWFDAYGWSVENKGVAPDIDVLRTPLDWAEGRHAQLTDAVELALGLLETNPPATPPTYSDVPDRSRPKLPPRT
ncbi:S41 family peptidase [Streptomyces sp. NRRL S-146]|uniref:S41 family peptidase n=1 Tax=Streptomyces sp. NRRL S-146 TaxID=1463884 RepID=UPI0004C95E39|nr:S41 family peptidase [Streptomyces sp. NRRL S-146]